MTNKTIIMTSIIAMAFTLVGSQTMIPAQAATGDILADHPNDCWGIAFDGTHLWCTPDDDGPVGNDHILAFDSLSGAFNYGIDTSSLTIVSLAYDNNAGVLWGNVFGEPTQTFVKIDPTNGDILDTIVTTIPFSSGWSDGLSYDEITDTLWASPEDGGFNNNIYQIDPSNGDILQTLNIPSPSNGWSGIAVTGDSIWLDDKQDSIDQFDLAGISTGITFPNAENSEDLAFDNQTFEGKCAVWSAQTLIAYEIPCPSTQKVCDEYEGVTICKTADISDPEDTVHRVGDVIEFDFSIVVTTSSTTLTDVVVKDRLGGDLMSFENSLVSTDSLTCTLGTPLNHGGHEKGGKTNKEFLDCVAIPDGELEPQSIEEINFSAKTDVNPGQQKQAEKGKQPKNEYTSCGLHEANSGATIEFWWFGQDPEVDEPTILKTPPISVEVFDESYPDSDCDMDGIDDPVDACPFDPETVNGFEDEDGCPDEAP